MDIGALVAMYVMVAVVCAMPWILNWAMHGSLPIITRLLSLLTLVATLGNAVWVLWEIRADAPDRLGEAVRIVAPLILGSVVGMRFVLKSLVKLVPVPPREEEN